MSRLSREHWVNAALRLLIGRGVDAVRVEPLAKALKVTKGSFYWHFVDRQALLQAMLDTWQSKATDAIIAEVETRGGDTRTRLANLFRITVSADGRLERAIRSWAVQDQAAAAALQAVDGRRVGYLAALFQELGHSEADGLVRARLGYLALIGQHMTDAGPGPAGWLADGLDAILALLTQPPQANASSAD